MRIRLVNDTGRSGRELATELKRAEVLAVLEQHGTGERVPGVKEKRRKDSRKAPAAGPVASSRSLSDEAQGRRVVL